MKGSFDHQRGHNPQIAGVITLGRVRTTGSRVYVGNIGKKNTSNYKIIYIYIHIHIHIYIYIYIYSTGVAPGFN